VHRYLTMCAMGGLFVVPRGVRALTVDKKSKAAPQIQIRSRGAKLGPEWEYEVVSR
jgi:hypothetical protein